MPSRLPVISDDRPKILALASTVPARPGDGTPEFVLALARKLTSHFDIVVLTPRVPSAAREELSGGVVIRRFPYFLARWENLAQGAILPNLRSRPWTIVQAPPLVLAFIWATLAEVRRLRPSLLHAHWIIPGGLVAWVVSKLTGRPYIVSAHGADGFALQGFPWRWIKRLVLQGAVDVLPTSREMAEQLDLAATDPGTKVVPMGVDVGEIEIMSPERQTRPGTFLFVGRLEDKKGVDILLRSAAVVPEIRIVIIGDGNSGPSLCRLMKDLDIADRVRFLGQTGREEVLGQMQVAQAVVIPSHVGRGGDRETTPLVMSEAMAAGVPVIASRVGGLAEQISDRENGILFSPGSVESLAASLRFAYENPDEMARYARRAKEMIKGGPLDLDYTAARYAEAYVNAMRRASNREVRTAPR